MDFIPLIFSHKSILPPLAAAVLSGWLLSSLVHFIQLCIQGRVIQGQLHAGTSERPGKQAAHVLAEAARKRSINLVVYKQQRYFSQF